MLRLKDPDNGRPIYFDGDQMYEASRKNDPRGVTFEAVSEDELSRKFLMLIKVDANGVKYYAERKATTRELILAFIRRHRVIVAVVLTIAACALIWFAGWKEVETATERTVTPEKTITKQYKRWEFFGFPIGSQFSKETSPTSQQVDAAKELTEETKRALIDNKMDFHPRVKGKTRMDIDATPSEPELSLSKDHTERPHSNSEESRSK